MLPKCHRVVFVFVFACSTHNALQFCQYETVMHHAQNKKTHTHKHSTNSAASLMAYPSAMVLRAWHKRTNTCAQTSRKPIDGPDQRPDPTHTRSSSSGMEHGHKHTHKHLKQVTRVHDLFSTALPLCSARRARARFHREARGPGMKPVCCSRHMRHAGLCKKKARYAR